MIHLSQEEYIELLRAQEKLKCLEVGGVDNWEWYGEAMEDYVDPAERIKIEAQAKEILDFLASYTEVEQDPAGLGTGYKVDFDSEAEEAITRMLIKIDKECNIKIEDIVKAVKG
jgi:hypothetical protein